MMSKRSTWWTALQRRMMFGGKGPRGPTYQRVLFAKLKRGAWTGQSGEPALSYNLASDMRHGGHTRLFSAT